MTYYISEDSASSLRDGIETIVIPIRDSHDLGHLVFHTQRGGAHDVVEWLLSELGRSTEIERVCGLSITPLPDNKVVVNLELRQPGLQMEEWLVGYHLKLSYKGPNGPVEAYEILPNGESAYLGKLSERALSREQFTEKHRPWWEGKVPDTTWVEPHPELVTGD